MPTILSAKESQVLLAGPEGGAGAPIEGLQAISFRVNRSRQDIAAIGSDERIGVDFGLKLVVGTLTVRSTSTTLDSHPRQERHLPDHRQLEEGRPDTYGRLRPVLPGRQAGGVWMPMASSFPRTRFPRRASARHKRSPQGKVCPTTCGLHRRARLPYTVDINDGSYASTSMATATAFVSGPGAKRTELPTRRHGH